MCFDLTSHLQAYLRTIKLITICLCTFGIPDGSQSVLGFAYNVIPTCCCIYVYNGGDVCAASWGRCSCGPGYVRWGFFRLLAFQFSDFPLNNQRLGKSHSPEMTHYLF